MEYKRIQAEIPVRDGSKLAADIYMPQKEGRYPAIIWMTPYNKNNAHPSFLESIMGVPFSKPVTSEGLAPKVFWQTSDYVILCVDWRGRGTGVSLQAAKTGNPHQNGLDGYDVIEWVASQPWCTGKIGMWGTSAGGVVQFEVAATRPPHLTCITPGYANFERSYESYFHGGVEWKEYLDRVQPVYTTLVQTVRQHPLDDGTYDNLLDGDPKDIEVPVLLQGGWWDLHDMTDVYNEFYTRSNDQARKTIRCFIGPWIHGGGTKANEPTGEMTFEGTGQYYEDTQRTFFDYWLRGIDRGYSKIPAFSYYVVGKNEWRTADRWPPAESKMAAYYLNGEGSLSLSPSSGSAAPKQFIMDPKNPVPTIGGSVLNKLKLIQGPADQSQKVETHKDVLVFSTEVLKEDLNVIGDVEIKLYVSSDSEDTDVTIRLTDVYPDGRSMLIREDIQRLSHLEGNKQEKPLQPGQVYEVTLKPWAISNSFLKGHRLRLVVATSNYPHYDVNNGSLDRKAPPKVITNKLYLDSKYPSQIKLPLSR